MTILTKPRLNYEGDRMTNPWTDERIALLKQHHASGLSAAQIAVELGGITRNAVCGKIHRLGLAPLPRAVHPNDREKVREARRARFRKLRPLLCITAELASPEPPVVILPLGEPCTLLQLSPDTCRWPLWQDDEPRLFCAAMPAEGRPYCEYHQTIGTQKPRQ